MNVMSSDRADGWRRSCQPCRAVTALSIGCRRRPATGNPRYRAIEQPSYRAAPSAAHFLVGSGGRSPTECDTGCSTATAGRWSSYLWSAASCRRTGRRCGTTFTGQQPCGTARARERQRAGWECGKCCIANQCSNDRKEGDDEYAACLMASSLGAIDALLF